MSSRDALSKQAERLRILHEIDRAILAARSPAEIAHAAAEGVLRITDAVRVNVALWQPQGDTLETLATAGPLNPALLPGTKVPIQPWPWLLAARQGQVAFEEDLSKEADLFPEAQAALAQGIRSQAVIPLMVGGESIGHLALSRRSPGRLPDEDLALAQQIADSLAVAMHNARLFEEVQKGRQQLRSLSHHLVMLQEAQQQALSRELHDRSGQSTTALKLGLGLLRREAEGAPALQAHIDELRQMADQVAVELHDLAVSLRPSALDRYGLVPGLEQLVASFRKQNPVEVDIVATGLEDERLADEVEIALYRVVQEGLTNIARHAQARHVGIMLNRNGATVSLIVEDDGRGFDVDEALNRGRLGLLGMRERAEMLGGTLTIESMPGGGGTTVFVDVPAHLGRMADVAVDTPAPVLAAAQAEPPQADAASLAAEQDAAELARAKALSDVLVDITYDVGLGAAPDEILERALARSVAALGCETAAVIKREGAGWVISHGYHLPQIGLGQRFSDEEFPAAVWAESTRQVVVIDDTATSSFPGVEWVSQYGICSLATVPIMLGDASLGVLSLMHNTAPVPFHPSEVEFLNRLAGLVSLAVENAQLHEVESRQRAVLETVLASIPVGLAVIAGSDFEIKLANASYRSLTPRPEVDPVGWRYAEIWPSVEGFDRGELRLAGVVETGQPLDVQHQMYVFPDGSQRFFDFHARRLFWNGEPAALVELEDTTAAEQAAAELARANASLAEERDRLRTLLTSIPDEVWFCDAEGKIMAANPAAVRGLGLPATGEDFQPFIDWTALEMLNANGKQRPLEQTPLLRALRGEEVRGQEEIIRLPHTGELRYRQASGDAIRDDQGQIVGAVLVVRDVTQWQLAEQERNRMLAAWAASEERYRQLFTTMDEGFALIRLIYDDAGHPADYEILDMNPAYERMSGFVRETMLGKTVRQFYAGQEPPAIAVYGQVARTSEPAHFETFSDLTQRRWNVSVYNPGQDLIAVVFSDITERRLAESEREAALEELRHAVAQLDGLLSAIPSGLIVYDRDGRIVRMNALAQGMLGYDDATWRRPVGERVTNAVRLSSPDGVAYGWEEYPAIRALRGEVVRNEDVFLHLPARPANDFWAMMSAGPVFGPDGELLGAVVTMTNTSEFHRVSEQLGEANDRLQSQADELRELAAGLDQRVQTRTAELMQREAALAQANVALREQADLLDLAYDAIIVRGVDGALRYWNRGATEMYGWAPEEALGKVSRHLLRTVFPQPLEEIEAHVLQEGRWEGELTHTRRDGTQVIVASRWALQRDEDGQPLGILEINTDITERKRAEQALRQQSERLEILHAIDRSILAAHDLREIAQVAIERVQQVAQAQRATVVLCDFPTGMGEILAASGVGASGFQAGMRVPLAQYPLIERVREGQPATVEDMEALPDDWAPKAVTLRAGIRSASLMPLAVGDQVIGVLTISREEVGSLPPGVAGLCAHVADSLAVALYNARLHQQLEASREQLQAFSRRLVEVQERERRFVADQLYNQTAQVLAAVKLNLAVLKPAVQGEPDAVQRLHETQDMLERAIRELHDLAAGLRPALLDRLGLVAALQHYVTEFGQRNGLSASMGMGNMAGQSVPAEIAIVLYRIAQEALANVAEHSAATQVDVLLNRHAEGVTLIVEDNGRGFDLDKANQEAAPGLVEMRERAESVGGHLTIETAGGRGTTVLVEIPF
jgi:PAS domain S-box-containing protein